MTTSGTTTFNLDLSEIVEEAFERCGSELRSGYDLKTARRSLNLLLAEWANQGVNLWTIDQGTITLTSGLNTYAIPADTVDLLEHVIRTQANNSSTQSDLSVTRISVSTYATIPNKLTQARPIQIMVQRRDAQEYATSATLAVALTATDDEVTLSSAAGLATSGYVKINSEYIYYGYITGNTLMGCFRGQNGSTATTHAIAPTAPTVYVANLPAVVLWPVPDSSQTYQLVYWRLRRLQDAGNGINTMDVPFRFVPPLVAGLAYHMALKIPNALERLPILKAQYEQAWDIASGEDREKASVRFVPRQAFIG